ncbi:MAG: type III secretion system export apparatus subunit SctS [Chromatiaceae bacterium]|nr:type III secretion system export apparatus subunit SctS [Chromatiaceae bacterium]MCP5315845.1 type III secretion system export apparatus subunit SctS [Chromatiaceae bacterium]
MNQAQVIEYATNALLLVLYLSLPPIIAAATVGTLVSLMQALTQIQEQTLSFGIKLFVVVITIFLTAQWLGTELFQFAFRIFNEFHAVQR